VPPQRGERRHKGTRTGRAARPAARPERRVHRIVTRNDDGALDRPGQEAYRFRRQPAACGARDDHHPVALPLPANDWQKSGAPAPQMLRRIRCAAPARVRRRVQSGVREPGPEETGPTERWRRLLGAPSFLPCLDRLG
jgi:hypothetical protein